MAKAHAPLRINLARPGLIKNDLRTECRHWSPRVAFLWEHKYLYIKHDDGAGEDRAGSSAPFQLPELEAKITYFRIWILIYRISTAWRCGHHHCIMWSSCVLSKLCTGAGAFLEGDLMTQRGMAFLCFLPTGNCRSISDLRESQDNSCLMLSSSVVTEKATTVKSIFFVLPLVPVLSFHCDIRPFNIVFSLLSCLFRRHHPDALY